MTSISTMKRLLTTSTSFLIALMFTLGLGVTAQAKERISYIHNGISGSPVAATDETGALKWEEVYKPYGERLNKPNTDNDNWFTGKQEEQDTGLQYFGARWYHQKTGRFISRDPAGVLDHVESNPMMFNRYAYANNNPYKYVDPDGRMAQLAGANAAGITGTFVCGPVCGGVAWLAGLGVTTWGMYEVKTYLNESSSGTDAESDSFDTDNPNTSNPMQGEPGSVSQSNNKNGKKNQERLYGEDGWPDFDIDYDHDHKANGTNQETGKIHGHQWGRPSNGESPTWEDRSSGFPI